VDASYDQYDKAGAIVAYFHSSGHMHFVQLQPFCADSPFQAEAKVLLLALRDWQSPYFEKPRIIYIDCQQLVSFVQDKGDGALPCWKGA
jgi:hypothetical protein